MQEENTQALSCQQFELITESNIKINGLSNINESLSTHYLIYRIDNLENGKHYIGQHQTENPFDKYMGSGDLIIQAVAKYGIEKFVKTILFDFDNFEEMNEKEKELVPLSACYPHDPMSYNLREGGFNGQSSQLSRDKMSKSQSYRLAHLTDEQLIQWLKKLSKASAGQNNPMYGDFEHTKGFRAENVRRKGKTLEQIWGIDKANTIKERISVSVKGQNNPCFGRKWMYNPITKDKVYVLTDDVERYKALGYVNKTGLQTTKGSKWINNGISEMQVQPNKLDEYLNSGWNLGKLHNTRKMIDPKTNRYKYVKPQMFQTYLDKGYIFAVNEKNT